MHEESNSTSSDQLLLKCTNCGANMKFAAGKSALKCDACGTENEIAKSEEVIEELNFNEYIKKAIPKEDHQEITVVTCDSCGASTRFNPNIVSDECGFCTSPLTVKNASKCDVLNPKSLLPFYIDQKKGFEEFKKWIDSLWFAPNDLKKYASNTEKLSGIYLPYWTYDADTKSSYTGQRGINRTESYTAYEDGKAVTKTRTVTDWYYTSGMSYVSFDDILVVATKSLPKNYLDALEPWDLKNLVPFDEKYLSGFKAENYQVDLSSGFDVSKGIMDYHIREKVKKDIGGDKQQITTLFTDHMNVKFKHILLPVWLSAFKYNDKVYRFMINGRTGEVQGERPHSFWKAFFFVLMILGIIVGIIWLIIYLQQ